MNKIIFVFVVLLLTSCDQFVNKGVYDIANRKLDEMNEKVYKQKSDINKIKREIDELEERKIYLIHQVSLLETKIHNANIQTGKCKEYFNLLYFKWESFDGDKAYSLLNNLQNNIVECTNN